MSMSIWKVPLRAAAAQAIKMPQGAKVLSVGLQNEQPQLWFHCDESAPLEDRWIALCMTGGSAPSFNDARHFIGTLQFANGIVMHAFELNA